MSTLPLWIIPAKGQSARVPGKNLRPLGDLPLFLHTVRCACAVGGTVIVATDCAKVRRAALAYGHGVQVLRRPESLSAPTCSAVDVVLWAMRELGVPYADWQAVGMLLPTSPFRTAATIEACLRLWARDTHASVVTVREVAQRTLRYETAGGWLAGLNVPGYYGRLTAEGWPKAPKTYVSTGGVQLTSAASLYAYRRYWQPKARPVVVGEMEGLDIDTEEQFQVAEAWVGASG